MAVGQAGHSLGGLLFKRIKGRNVNRFLRKSLSVLHVPAANRYSSHGFRRGAAQELNETGSHWPIVASVGQWGGLSFKNYVDLYDELSRGLSKLFTHSYNFESEDEGAMLRMYRWVSVALRVLGTHTGRPFSAHFGYSLGYSGMRGARTNLCSLFLNLYSIN